MSLYTYERLKEIVKNVVSRGIDVKILENYKYWQALFKIWQFVKMCMDSGKSFDECKYVSFDTLASCGLAVEPHQLTKLLVSNILKYAYKSRRYTIYELNLTSFEELEALVRWFNKYDQLPGDRSIEDVSEMDLEEWRKLIPQDLFESIVGYDDVKEFIKMSLMSNEPVHCLFVGPPGTAKSIPGDVELVVKVGEDVKVMKIRDVYNLFENGCRDVKVLSVDPYSLKTCWKRVLGVAMIYEYRPLVRVVLSNGSEAICTVDHSLVTLDLLSKFKILRPVKAGALTPGDKLPIVYNIPTEVVELGVKPSVLNTVDNVVKFGDVVLTKVAKVELIEFKGVVYDLMVEDTEIFVSSELIPYHNTLFLLELSRIPGAKYVTADQVSGAGLRDLLMTERPRILLIDELDKFRRATDISALLEWMERGTVTKLHSLRYGGYQIVRGKGWVFAAANRLEKIPAELRSRFEIFYFPEYTHDEYVKVASTYIAKTYKIPEDIAKYIAEECAKRTRDIRKAINVAKLIKRYVDEGRDKNEILKTVKRIIEIRDKYAYRKQDFLYANL